MLATIKLKLKTKRLSKSPRNRFDLEKLKENIKVFQAKVGEKFAALFILGSGVDTLANNLKEVLILTAEEVLGRKRNQSWVTNWVLDPSIRDGS